MKLPDNIQEIAPLILKWLRDELSVEEQLQIDKWASKSEQNRVFLQNISEERILKIAVEYDEEKIWNKIQEGISGVPLRPTIVERPNSLFKRVAIAASIAAILGVGAWIFWATNHKKETDNLVSIYKNDVMPGGNKATLILSNGSTITLDTMSKGRMLQEGTAKISRKENGQLAYAIDPSILSHGNEQLFNTVSTPRGGNYQLLLADGTRIWLNSESSVRYPVYFTGNERTVELTGEAYFEVAKNPKLPFKVNVKGATVEVLGTHFDIMAYSDEREMRTTLLEGSVKVSQGTQNNLLKPGQQSLIDESGTLNVRDKVNLEEVISWQRGVFQFENADIKTIMRQVARWYDVDISFKGNIPDHFNATIPRNVSVSKLFGILELTGHVHFHVDEKKIIVLP